MMPSLYSGISGLNAHQNRMNVIGNNVANVNTIGYKSSIATFKESYINTIRTPASGTPGIQVGLGVDLGAITRRFSSGMLQETGVPTHMAVNGDGFFAVATASGEVLFSRSGDFVLDLDPDGTYIHLITPDGHVLQGSDGAGRVDINLLPSSGEPLASFSVSSTGEVTLVDVTGATEILDTRVKVMPFQNNNGLKAEGANLYSYTPSASGSASVDDLDWGYNVDYAGTVLQGYTESSNTDLAKEFTEMIVSQRGFQANARTVTTSDEILAELMAIKR